MSGIILPGDPLFDLTLSSSPPPGWTQTAAMTGEQCAFVVRLDSGLMEPVAPSELEEYLLGGEYQERIESIGLAD